MKNQWLVLVLTLCITACSSQSGKHSISELKIPAVPPGSKVMAGYFRLTNATDKPLTLVKVTGKQFSSIEMHRTVITQGVASMERKLKLTVAPRSTLAFQPGGLHLMLFNPKQHFTPKQSIELVFHFEQHATIHVKGEVVDRATMLKH